MLTILFKQIRSGHLAFSCAKSQLFLWSFPIFFLILPRASDAHIHFLFTTVMKIENKEAKKVSRTWEAAMRLKGSIVVLDKTLLN